MLDIIKNINITSIVFEAKNHINTITRGKIMGRSRVVAEHPSQN